MKGLPAGAQVRRGSRTTPPRQGSKLRAEACALAALLGDDEVESLLQRLENGLPVQGNERAGSMTSISMPSAGELGCGCEGLVHHPADSDDGAVVAAAVDAGLAEGDRVVPFGHLALQREQPPCSKKRTGLSSRTAVLKRPFASYGFEGTTTLSPGGYVNAASMLCEWPYPAPPRAGGRLDDHRDAQGAAAHVMPLPGLVGDHLHGEEGEVAEHDLHHGAQRSSLRRRPRPRRSTRRSACS